MRADVKSRRTHMLPVAIPKAAPSAGEGQAKCFDKPHSRRCAAALFATLSRARGNVAQSRPRAPAVDTTWGNLQTLSDAFVGKATAHRELGYVRSSIDE
jgi:hypothetical protein